jgi:tetratricopeptide (TPR) repeat protein
MCGCSKDGEEKTVVKNVTEAPLFSKASVAIEKYNQGCSLQESGNVTEAIVYYRQAIALDGTHADAHYNLASSLQELGQFEEAEKHYKRTVTICPGHHLAFYNMGYLYQEMGKMDKSIEAFKKASKIEPNDSDTVIKQISH